MVAEHSPMTVADAPRSGTLPTSPAQDALWMLDRLVPPAPEHRATFSYRITGRLRPEALRAAWQAVVARHDVLRSRITEADGCPQQTIDESVDSFSLIDVTLLPPADRARRADAICAALVADPVSLADGPLARLGLVRLAPDAHRAVLVVHRAAADDHSLSLLIDELSECYTLALTSRHGLDALRATPRPLRYADYARWHRRQQEAAGGSGELVDWWRAALTPLPAAPVLPAGPVGAVGPAGLADVVGPAGLADVVGPADVVGVVGVVGPAGSGGVWPFDWGTTASGRLARFCQAEGVRPAHVLLAALQAVLCRYGAEHRVAVCVAVSVRPPELAGVLGQCDNLLVLSSDLAGAPAFGEAVHRVARASGAALERATLPFADAIGTIEVDRDPTRLPLGGVLFDGRAQPVAELRLAGVAVDGGLVDATPTRSDLALTVRRFEPSITGTIGCRGGRAARAPAAALVLEHVRTLLLAGVQAPGTPVHELPLDDVGRARAAARAANRIGAGPPGETPVHELVRRRGERSTAAAVAAAAGEHVVSYQDLLRESALVASHLRSFGVAGSAVAVRMPHGAPQLAASLAVLRAGGHLIWFGAGDAGERARFVLAQRRPACLLVAGDPDELARWYGDELGGRVVDVTALERGWADDAAVTAAVDRTTPDRPVYIAHTSGSTGRPKGIAQTHGSFAQFVTWMAGALDLRPSSRVAQWVAADHDPSLCEVFATLVAGGTLCPVPDRVRMHPEKFLSWLIDERITFLQTVPSFAREVLKAIRDTGAAARLGALERLVLMGEALPGKLAHELRVTLPGTRLVNLYGPTETIAATWCEVTAAIADGNAAAVPIGEPIPGREVLVLDEADRPCPAGVIGEIVIRGPHVANGYLSGEKDGGGEGGGEKGGGEEDGAFRPVRGLGDPDLRCYRTGDLACRRGDGLLEFRGRRDQQVKVQGNRLELAEVETALVEHASVAECAVVASTDQDGLVSHLIAYVVPERVADGPAPAGPQAWRAHLRARFGRALPVSFETLNASMPRNVAGKVDRTRLPAPRTRAAASTPAPDTWTPDARAPDTTNTTVERDVARLWSELLGGARVGATETFYAVGGHSLMLPQLHHRIRQQFGVDIPLRDCYANPTVAAMSAFIVAARSGEMKHRDLTAAGGTEALR